MSRKTPRTDNDSDRADARTVHEDRPDLRQSPDGNHVRVWHPDETGLIVAERDAFVTGPDAPAWEVHCEDCEIDLYYTDEVSADNAALDHVRSLPGDHDVTVQEVARDGDV